MPELPDLEVFSDNLTSLLKGKKLIQVDPVAAGKMNTTGKHLKAALEGQKLISVTREGKQLYFRFSGRMVLAMHLMLHGALKLFDPGEPPEHTIITFRFYSGPMLALTDWQGAATITLNPETAAAPDALAGKITFRYLKNILGNRRRTIKAILTDQKLIRGIGNAYADEILWLAGISPFSAGNKIPDEYIRKLVSAIRKTLRDAVKHIKSDHRNIISGEFRDFLSIHNAGKTQSPGGAKIRHKVAGGRKTYYTDEQKLFQ